MTFTRSRQERRIHLTGTAGRICAIALTLTAVALPASAGAGTTTAIKTGYYSSLTKVPSAVVEFHVRAQETVPDLGLVCFPKNPAWVAGSGEAQIDVHLPTAKISGNRIYFNGVAKVTAVDSTKKAAEEKFMLNIHHVDGPVFHYTYEGQKLQETRAWEGTVSSPACKKIAANGSVKLYGPVPGE